MLFDKSTSLLSLKMLFLYFKAKQIYLDITVNFYKLIKKYLVFTVWEEIQDAVWAFVLYQLDKTSKPFL